MHVAYTVACRRIYCCIVLFLVWQDCCIGNDNSIILHTAKHQLLSTWHCPEIAKLLQPVAIDEGDEDVLYSYLRAEYHRIDSPSNSCLSFQPYRSKQRKKANLVVALPNRLRPLSE